jgi:hypothetical protein
VKRIGPDLKMPKLRGSDVKVPPFLGDLYHDLRDRRLLPLIALILVAIVATPLLLSDDSPVEVPSAPPVAASPGLAPASKKTLTVVKAAPGLRNYKKRLSRRKPTNPFGQRFTAPVLAGSELGEETATATTTEGDGTGATAEPSESASTAPSGESAPPAGGGGSGGAGQPPVQSPSSDEGLRYFAFALTVEISRAQTKPDGTVDKGAPTKRDGVLPPTPLPGAKAPVVTYIGLSVKTQKPLFMVSPEVTSTFGEGKCVAGTSTCQLIELEAGFPETFVYGPNDVRYKVKVLKVERITEKS